MTSDERDIQPVHEAYAGLIARAADDSLDTDGRRRLDEHLTACAVCREAFEDQRLARETLMAWQPKPASIGFAERVVRAADAPQGFLDGWDFRAWTWRLAPVTAALAAAAAVVVVTADSAASTGAAPASSMAATAEPIASLALATGNLSDTEAVALLLLADPDETPSAAFEEMNR